MKRKEYIKKLVFINLPIILISVIYLILFYTVFQNSQFFRCITKEYLHVYCPACGGSRALVSLLKFNLLESFILFPPLLLAVIIIFELDFRMFLCAYHNTDKYMKNYTYRRFYILVFFIVANFILKNALLVFFNIDLIGDIHRT